MAKLPFRHISISDNWELSSGSVIALAKADSLIHRGEMKTYNLQDKIEWMTLVVLWRIQSWAVILRNNISNFVKSMIS